MIGLPLRLLAREVYDRVVERVGAEQVALITGEEKIKPDQGRATGSAPSRRCRATSTCAFVAIDEIQLAADLERGHVFTDRLLNRAAATRRCCSAPRTMRRIIETLLPGVNVVTRPRLSQPDLRRREEDHPPAAPLAPSSPSRPTRSTPSPN